MWSMLPRKSLRLVYNWINLPNKLLTRYWFNHQFFYPCIFYSVFCVQRYITWFQKFSKKVLWIGRKNFFKFLGFQSLHSQTHLIYFPLSKCDKMEILAEGDRGISPANFTLHWFSIRLWFGQLHHYWNWICWFAGGSRYCLTVLLDQDKCNVVYRWILSVGLARVEISENWWYMT